MPFWKRLILMLYYHASYPERACNLLRLAAKGSLPIIVLYYHRVADDLATPWTISNAMFLRQINWLRENFEFITLADCQERIRTGRNSQPCVSITFDDGYADNCQQAIPWLIKERIPCTYFVTLNNILTGEPFAHDMIRGHRFSPNTVEQLRAMASSGIEIGSHTYTHADFGILQDPRLLRHEIFTAKQELEAALNRSVRYLAFPYGQYVNLSPVAFLMAKEAGFQAVCSAYGGYNFPGDDAFHLQRIPADNEMIRLKNWVSLDPRKLRIKRYDYQAACSNGNTQGVKSKVQDSRSKDQGSTNKEEASRSNNSFSITDH